MGQVVHGKVISPARLRRGHEKARKRAYAENSYGATLRHEIGRAHV
jgi:hypothetical protein